jgi:hypothetical protein
MKVRLPLLLTVIRSGLVLSLLLPAESAATCNTIPVVARTFPSNIGSVDRPIAEPGGQVTITLECPASGPGFVGFDLNPANNDVTLLFQSALGGSASVTVPPTDITVNDTETLQFKVPVTAATHPPHGFAGPAKISVNNTTAGQTVAEIEQLWEPVLSGCDQSPPTTFEKFVVLPEPNNFGTQVNKDDAVLMTLDGGNNLLIPLDHGSVLPAPGPLSLPVARFESGIGLFAASSTLAGKISEKLAAAKAAYADQMADIVRSFSIEGRPLPPLLRVDDQGALFGTTDAALSVLRIAQSYEHPPGTMNQIHDLQHLLKPPAGPQSGTRPIVIKNTKLCLFGLCVVFTRRFEVDTCYPVPLAGLRASKDIVAYARNESRSDEGKLNGDPDEDDRVVQVHEDKRGGQNCGSNTTRAVAELTTFGFPRPILEVGDKLAGFLQAEDDTLRVFRADGAHDTAGFNLVADRAEKVNQRTLAISDPLVFFRTPGGELRVFDAVAHNLRAKAQTGAIVAAVHSQRAIVLTPENGTHLNADSDTTDDVAQLYDGLADSLIPLAVAGHQVAISKDLVALTVPEAEEGNAPRNNDGDAADDVLAVQPLPIVGSGPNPKDLKVAADAIGVTDSTVVFITPETSEASNGKGCTATPSPFKCDLNSDNDPNDRVVRIYRHATGTFTEVGLPAEDFVVEGTVVAFRSPEAEQNSLGPGCLAMVASGGCDRNGDGDDGDSVMYVYDLETDTLYGTGQAAFVDEALLAKHGLDWMRPYKVGEDVVFFLTNESDQKEDLDADGAQNSTVLQIFNFRSNQILVPATINDTGGPKFVAHLEQVGAGRTILRLVGDPSIPGSVVVGDQDEDGTPDPVDVCVHDANPQQFDDDLDGLGDRFCDPTYCSTFVPPAPRRRPIDGIECQPMARKAAVKYLTRRAEATVHCLNGIAGGSFSGEPTAYCRGYFVGDVEVLPLEKGTAHALRESAQNLTRAILLGCRDRGGSRQREVRDPRDFARRVLRTLGESVNAATRIAYGNVRRVDPSALRCQRGLGAASTRYLGTVVEAMQACLEKPEPGSGREDLGTRCLGRLQGGRVVPPTEAREAIEAAELELHAAVRKHCRDEDTLAGLDACGPGIRSVTECLICTNWRRAAEAIRSMYGPEVVDPPPFRHILARVSQ